MGTFGISTSLRNHNNEDVSIIRKAKVRVYSSAVKENIRTELLGSPVFKLLVDMDL